MAITMTRRMALLGCVALAACGRKADVGNSYAAYAGATPELVAMIDRTADELEIPRRLLHRVVQRESSYRSGARNGPYWGLMQILPETARTMGFRGVPSDLLDAQTNLTYAGRYLRGAYLVARRNEDRAVHWYASGYYYEAKRMGLLEETGLRGGRWRA